ncbi:MAG: hypothetical protein ACI3ZW_02010, partial [Parabacteroides sp.]
QFPFGNTQERPFLISSRSETRRKGHFLSVPVREHAGKAFRSMVFVGKEADVGLFSVVLPRWKPKDACLASVSNKQHNNL